MPTYDSALRIEFVAWSRANLNSLIGIDVLGRSKLVAMGVAVGNIVLGGKIKLHSKREGDYSDALRRAGLSPAVAG